MKLKVVIHKDDLSLTFHHHSTSTCIVPTFGCCYPTWHERTSWAVIIGTNGKIQFITQRRRSEW